MEQEAFWIYVHDVQRIGGKLGGHVGWTGTSVGVAGLLGMHAESQLKLDGDVMAQNSRDGHLTRAPFDVHTHHCRGDHFYLHQLLLPLEQASMVSYRAP